MKKKIIWLVIGCLAVSLFLSGCGVSQEDYDALLAERDAGQAEATELQVEVDSLQDDVSEAQKQIETLEGNISELESDLDSAQGQISSLQGQVSNANGSLARAQEQIADLEEIAPVLLYEDDFDSPNSGWAKASEEYYECGYEDGEYFILVRDPRWTVWSWNTAAGNLTDFALEVDARLKSGAQDTWYGLVFRLQDPDNFYYLGIYDDGCYEIYKRVDNAWETLRSKAQSPYIEEDNATNHIKVVCKGSQIVTYVNGYHLITIKDTTFTGGYVGMAGGTIGYSEGKVVFDNIRVLSLD